MVEAKQPCPLPDEGNLFSSRWRNVQLQFRAVSMGQSQQTLSSLASQIRHT